jgi:predicted nucleic acid-binding protein
VKYRLSKKIGAEKTGDVVSLIEQIPQLFIVSINSEVAKYAADLRLKYYQPKVREMSYSDALNLATAIKTGCKTLYSGDPDFQNIKEIRTVIIK